MQSVKGMVQVAGTTYRIVRVGAGKYEVVRILDDLSVGMFVTEPKLQVTSHRIERPIMTEIARCAVRGGRVSWVGRLLLQKN